MLTQTYAALISLLEQEEAIYGEMAVALNEEREALLAMAADRLGELASRKETLALRVKALDESRKLLARRLESALGIPPEELTVTRLVQHAPSGMGERLRRVGQTLRQSVERCQAVNQFNERAARRGMSLLGGAIQYLIAQADPAGKLYQAPRPKGYAAGGHSGASGFISRQV